MVYSLKVCCLPQEDSAELGLEMKISRFQVVLWCGYTRPLRAGLRCLPLLPAPKFRHHPSSFAKMSNWKCIFLPFNHGAQCHGMLQRPENRKDLKKELGKAPEMVSVKGAMHALLLRDSGAKAGRDEARALCFL